MVDSSLTADEYEELTRSLTDRLRHRLGVLAKRRTEGALVLPVRVDRQLDVGPRAGARAAPAGAGLLLQPKIVEQVQGEPSGRRCSHVITDREPPLFLSTQLGNRCRKLALFLVAGE
jgi:hypothetical protein